MHGSGGTGSQQREVADGADVVFTDTLVFTPKYDVRPAIKWPVVNSSAGGMHA